MSVDRRRAAVEAKSCSEVEAKQRYSHRGRTLLHCKITTLCFYLRQAFSVAGRQTIVSLVFFFFFYLFSANFMLSFFQDCGFFFVFLQLLLYVLCKPKRLIVLARKTKNNVNISTVYQKIVINRNTFLDSHILHT